MTRPTLLLLTRLVVGLIVPLAAVQAQSVSVRSGPPVRSVDAFSQLLQSTRTLDVALALDRQTYFPGEDAMLTISVNNSGSTTIEAFDPFYPGNGHLNLYSHDSAKPMSDPRSWRRLDIHESSDLDRDAPTVWLSPGQPLIKRCVLSSPSSGFDVDSHGQKSATVCLGLAIAEDKGDYELRYSYGPMARVGFSIVWPQLESWTEVRFQQSEHFQQTDINGKPAGKPLVIPRLIRFAVLGYQGSHIVVVTVNPKTGAPPKPDPSGQLTGDESRYFHPFRRIATSVIPITSIQAVADSLENITLTYIDQTGKSFKLKLNANRDLMP